MTRSVAACALAFLVSACPTSTKPTVPRKAPEARSDGSTVPGQAFAQPPPTPLLQDLDTPRDREKKPPFEDKTASVKSAEVTVGATTREQRYVWSVQVSAFLQEGYALRMANKLEKKGYDAHVVPTKIKGRTWYRITVGKVARRTNAYDLQQALREKEGLTKAFITASLAQPLALPPPEQEIPEPPSLPDDEVEKISLDFEEADLNAVLRSLAVPAGIDFVLAQGVTAKVTMRIEEIPATEAFSIIQAILEANNLAAVKSGSIYKIVPVAAAQQQPTRIDIGKDLESKQGFITQIIPLQYLSAEDIAKVFQSLVAQGKLLSHRGTNTLILSAPVQVIREIVNILKVLDVQSQQLDDQQTFVYYVNNAKASELANILMTVFGEEAQTTVPGEFLPLGTPGTPPPPPRPPRPGVSTPGPELLPEAAIQEARRQARMAGKIRIVPDERTNALIIKATSRDYEGVKEILKKLDITPKQVIIEAFIAEVTLTDSFASSVEQFLRAGEVILQSSFGLAGPLPAPGFLSSSGFTFAFVDRDKFSLFLNMIAAHTKINTVASPHILTLDNKQARIQIGQEVPIVTGTQSTVTAVSGGGSDLFQTIQQKDIGRILMIRPHVNEKRQVTLDIELEAIDTISTSTGDIGSSSFSKRTVQTSVIVEDGQSILIGGIISKNKTRVVSEVPFLGRIPVLGRYFQTESESVDKTELLILITPHVIANPEEGRILTKQFSERLEWLEEQLKQIPPLNEDGQELESDLSDG